MNSERADEPASFVGRATDLAVLTRDLAVLRGRITEAMQGREARALADMEPSWWAVLSTTARLLFQRKVLQRFGRMRGLKRGYAEQRESDLARQMTAVALLMAGQRRAYLHDAWRSDLFAQDGQYISIRRQLRHGAGYLIAAVRYRLVNDFGSALGQLLDSVLASRAWTRMVVTCLYAIPVAMVLARQGSYGLVTNAEQFAVLAAGLGAGLRWLRRWRGVEPPKRDRESQ
jgi:hypothetical protein